MNSAILQNRSFRLLSALSEQTSNSCYNQSNIKSVAPLMSRWSHVWLKEHWVPWTLSSDLQTELNPEIDLQNHLDPKYKHLGALVQHYLLHKWCPIESDIRCIHLKGIKYDVTDGLGVKEPSTHKKECRWWWGEVTIPVFVQVVAQQANGVWAKHLEDEGLVTVLWLHLQCDDIPSRWRRLLRTIWGSHIQSASTRAWSILSSRVKLLIGFTRPILLLQRRPQEEHHDLHVDSETHGPVHGCSFS